MSAGSARAFVCECGQRSCRAEARLTEAEYAELRAAGLKVISSRHEAPTATIVQRGPGWVAIGRRRRPGTQRPQVELEGIAYCPVCAQETVPGPTGRCLWCSGELVGRREQAA